MKKVTISEKGQISIPVGLRKRLGLKKGDKLVAEQFEDAILLRPLPANPLLGLAGKYKTEDGESLTESLLKERRAERERESY